MVKLAVGLLAAVGMLFILGCDKGGGDTFIFTQDSGGSASGILPESAAKIAIEKAVPGGTNTIILSGGNATTGTGGDGGDWYADLYCPAGLVVASGVKTPDASFTVPTNEPTPYFGAEKLTVSSNLTLDVYVDTATANASTTVGTYYLTLGSSSVYRNATPLAPVVTGLEVQAGVTLTLGLNYNWGGSGAGQDNCYVWFDEDIVINGTVTVKDLTTGTVGGAPVDTAYTSATTATTADKGSLDIECDYNFFMGTTGRIDTSGDDATAANTRGGDGGRIYIYGRSGVYIHGGVYADGGNGTGTGIGGSACIYCGNNNDIGIETNNSSEDGGMIVITGANTISACGGNGATGGDAGGIEIYANTYLYNTSPINASGGNGSNGDGGDTRSIYLYSYYCSLYNSGDVTAVGGNATNGDGGDGAYVEMYACDDDEGMSNLYNSGDFTIYGGNATNGSGGDADEIYVYNEGSGLLVNTGIWLAYGGNGTGSGSTGGDGSDLEIYQYAGDDYGYGEYTNNHDIIWTGNIDLHGGNAETGGDGGDIYLDNTDYEGDGDYINGGTYFVGYQAVYADGGDGGTGGNGGYLEFETEDAEAFGCYFYTESGLIIYMADFYARGGVATAGWGGDGGYVDIEVEGESYYEENQVCLIHGDLYLQGGDGTLGGGDGIGTSEEFYIYAYHKVEIIGDVYGHGGNATAAGGDGGYGCYYGVDISATYDVVIQGNWYLYGGYALTTGSGGDADDDYVEIYAGRDLTISGDMQLNGGNSPAGSGGNGGDIYIFSQTWPTLWVGWTWDVSAGTGGTAGNKGETWIDWVNWDR